MADDSLPPFSGRNPSCPKCGATVKTTWHLIGGTDGDAPCWLVERLDEHLCRICPCCGYGWMEATQDSAPASTPTPLHRVLR